ncbi:MAG: LysE family transporter [Flavobacteriaceae bacterium]|nr:LysE family transporter [Flavobacteriaceae bacterium]
MDFYDIKSALLIGFFMAFMIGPVFFMLIQTSILKGARAAIVFDVGVVLADITFILIAYYGSRSLLEKIKDDPRLFFIGGLVLIIYGLITYFDKENKKESIENDDEIEVPIVKNNYLKLFLKGYFLNFINVGVLAFWLGTILVIGPSLKMDQNAIFSYFTIIIIGYFITDLGKIFLAKQLRDKLTPLVIYRVKRVMGIILIVCGVLLMLKGFIPNEEINNFLNKKP